MTMVSVLIPLSLFMATCFLCAFIWAVRGGQFDDTCTPAMRMLTDEPKPKNFNKKKPNNKN